MAMNGTELGNKIADAIMASNAPVEVKTQVKSIWQKIGNVIVDYIVANAEVPAGISVSTTGSQSAQSGATTEPGKII